ncbi:probable auxin efflux carrier component 8 isoform X1 [Asparagus officinalis]|uniref:probable auxin efflux carrier component 8 isoform X1 n=2 Tax=Asparagus officinalis TaxID=4686 RepID=UPI00098E6FBD|nr:probable auxin efflux carrier component 8 isoform X1 [Asparagus officinalis]
MISGADIYHVIEAIVPLYVAMILAYMSIKWWKLFTSTQCSGINKFVAKFSVPLLSFRYISINNPYQMNLKLLFSDTVQKLLVLLVLGVICKLQFRGSLDWLITGFSVSTLPNTLILGIPLIKSLYGDEAVKLLGQIVMLQSLIWYTLLLFLFEFRAAGLVADTPTESTEEATESPEAQPKPEEEEAKAISSKKSKYQTILLTVTRKLMQNPNTFSCLAGLIWSLVSFRWGLKLPRIVDDSISILADGGLGMAMFSLGLFMASQPKLIACGTWMMLLSMGARFAIGPATMAIPSYAIRMRGKLLSAAIIQAAFPQGIVPFVFANEYGLHPDILSTGVIIGMFVAIPVTLVYYLLLSIK